MLMPFKHYFLEEALLPLLSKLMQFSSVFLSKIRVGK